MKCKIENRSCENNPSQVGDSGRQVDIPRRYCFRRSAQNCLDISVRFFPLFSLKDYATNASVLYKIRTGLFISSYPD